MSLTYALDGRVVTMDGAYRVLQNGRVYVKDGRIAAVQVASAPAPAGFENVRAINTGGTLYPGMIELHNHLSYNALPLWKTPKLFAHRGQWGGHKDYRKLVSGPASVLGTAKGLVEAVVRFVEAKCLVSGVTTSQGLTLSSNAGIRRYYRGYVRNVENSEDAQLPNASTRIQDVDAKTAPKFLESLKRAKCLLLHLSEGVNDDARKHFLALKLPGAKWAITDALAGIHATALRAEDFAVMHAHGASMIWSPFSNTALYGRSVDLQAARDSGIRMALGSDWSPSGSKNLLGELKAARVAADLAGVALSSRDLVEMVTTSPAKILRWDALLGSLEPGKYADLFVVAGKSGDPYDHLVKALETDISLVAVEGTPRYGTTALMKTFGETERRRVGGQQRVWDLAQDTADPLVQQVGLGTAEARLADAMRRLPQLAADLENPEAAAMLLGTVIAGEPGRWVLELEQEDVPGLNSVLDGAAPLSQILVPMELDTLTVADDPERYFRQLALQPNLSKEFQTALAALHGVSLDGLSGEAPAVDRSVALSDFLTAAPQLTLQDQRTLAQQAIVLFEQAYVHLQLKRAMHAVEPVQKLRLLDFRLAQAKAPLPDLEFHREMTAIFQSVRDLHTNYLLPSPYRETTAFLPFLVEEADDPPRYLVSKLAAGFTHPYFAPGVEVRLWNGVPIRQAIAANGMRDAGSNEEANFARGLASLTIRPLVRVLPPDEEWVTVTYRDLEGVEREVRLDWRAGSFGLSPMLDSLDRDAAALGFDLQTDAANEARKYLFAPQAAIPTRGRVKLSEQDLPTSMPAVFRARRLSSGRNRYGYVRIFTFHVPSAEAFLEEFARLAEALPQEGLILDVRGNGGGLITAAEGLLQMLTPHPIEPEPAQFITTPLMANLCERNSPSPELAGLDFSEWLPSMRQAVRTGAVYSSGVAVTPRSFANQYGQRYHGPSVLITDALSYSATDLFAAGFQDHRIGLILGVHGNTGAGGANVWTYDLLSNLAGPGVLRPLPGGAGMRVAVRRMVRVGANAGMPLEDLGVVPDERHRMTRRDLLENNADLLEHGCQMLKTLPRRKLKATVAGGSLRVETAGMDRLDLYLDGRPAGSRNVTDGVTEWPLPGAGEIRLEGYLANALVASRRLNNSR